MSDITVTGTAPSSSGRAKSMGGILGRISVGQKIMLIVAMCIAFLAVVGAIGILSMAKIGDEIAQIAEADMPVSNAVSTITSHQLEQAILFESAMRVGGASGETHAGQFDEIVVKFDALAAQVEVELKAAEVIAENAIANSNSESTKAEFVHVLEALKKIEGEHASYDHAADAAFELLREGAIFEALEALNEIEPQQQALDHELEALTAELQQFTSEAATTAEHDEQSAIRLIAIVAIGAAFAGLIIAWFMARKNVSQPLTQIVNAMEELAKGNNDITVDISYPR